MKQLTSTRFFFSLKEALQTDADIDAEMLENDYTEFALTLFSGNITDCKISYRNRLLYTQTELSSLVEPHTKKKCHYLSTQSHFID